MSSRQVCDCSTIRRNSFRYTRLGTRALGPDTRLVYARQVAPMHSSVDKIAVLRITSHNNYLQLRASTGNSVAAAQYLSTLGWSAWCQERMTVSDG
jgi:hypothetical protein